MASKKAFLDADIVHLLAWLDFCVKTQVDFGETITDHLAESRKDRGEKAYQFTKAQVRDKLNDLARQSQKDRSQYEYRQAGSAYFTCVSREVNEEIKTVLTRLLKLRSQQLILSDATPGKSAIVDTMMRDRLPEAATRQSVCKGKSKSQQNGPDNLASHNSTHHLRDDNRMHQNSQTAATLATAGLVEPHESTSTVSCSREQDRKRKLENLEKIHAAELKSSDLEISMMRQQWYDEVDNLREQLEKKKEIEIELRVELHTREMAKSERRLAGNDRLEDKLADMRTNEYLLTKQVQDLRRQFNFASLNTQHVAMQTEQSIQSTMELIGSELESILHGHDSTEILRVPKSTSISNDLCTLMQSLSGDQSVIGKEISCLRGWLCKFDAETVVRSFVVAALQEWVFTSDFPNFSPSKSRLLSAYRQALVMHSGWRGLHNLERVAYHSIIETPNFQDNIIPRNAKNAASRLSKTLAPLFPGSGNASDEDNIVFETWGEDQNVCNNRRYRFTGIFEAAYRLKATTVMTDMQYEFMIYPPGTRNPQENATSSPRKQVVHSDQTRNNTFGDSSLLATMDVYNDVYREDHVDSALLHSMNFIKRPQNQRIESMIYKHNLIVANSGKNTTIGSTEDGLLAQISGVSTVSKASEHNGSGSSISAGENLDKDFNPSKPPKKDDVSQPGGAPSCSRCGKAYKYPKLLQKHVAQNQCTHYPPNGEISAKGNKEILFPANQRLEVFTSPDSEDISKEREKGRSDNVVIDGDAKSSNETIEHDNPTNNQDILQRKSDFEERKEICGKCEHRVRKSDVTSGQTHATCYLCKQDFPLQAFLKRQKADDQPPIVIDDSGENGLSFRRQEEDEDSDACATYLRKDSAASNLKEASTKSSRGKLKEQVLCDKCGAGFWYARSLQRHHDTSGCPDGKRGNVQIQAENGPRKYSVEYDAGSEQEMAMEAKRRRIFYEGSDSENVQASESGNGARGE